MRRITLWFLSTLSALVLLLSYHTSVPSRAGTVVVASTPTESAGGTASASTESAAGAASGSTESAAGAASDATESAAGAASDATESAAGTAFETATVTGDAVGTPYGPVEVQITVEGDQITDVQVLQVPWQDHHDQQINGYAVPVLIQETTDADSADIDMVSGATFTSQAYAQSLQSALDQL